MGILKVCDGFGSTFFYLVTPTQLLQRVYTGRVAGKRQICYDKKRVFKKIDELCFAYIEGVGGSIMQKNYVQEILHIINSGMTSSELGV